MKKAVSFTGHRPRKFITNNQKVNVFTKEFYTEFSEQLYKYLEQLYNKGGYRNFITGGAQGFDQLVFWQVYNLKYKYSSVMNKVFIPFKGQESRWKYSGLFGQEEYNKMLYNSDSVINCCTSIKDNITQLMYNRNHRMVDNSELICACITEDEYKNNNITGGTFETISYAKSNNKTIDYIITKVINNKLNIINIIKGQDNETT